MRYESLCLKSMIIIRSTQTDEVKPNLKEVETQTLERFTKTEDVQTQTEESSINAEIIETNENGEIVPKEMKSL